MHDLLQHLLQDTVPGVRVLKSFSLRFFRPDRTVVVSCFPFQDIHQADFRIISTKSVKSVLPVKNSGSVAQDRPDGGAAFTSVRCAQFPLLQIVIDRTIDINHTLLLQFHDADRGNEL